MGITKKGSRSSGGVVGDGFLQTAAALNATTQQVSDNVGNGSALYLATTSALVRGDKLQIGTGADSTYLTFNGGYFSIYNDGTLERNGGNITHKTNSFFPLRSHITGENTMPYSVLIGGGVVGNKPGANNTVEIIGMGASYATKAIDAYNNIGANTFYLDDIGRGYFGNSLDTNIIRTAFINNLDNTSTCFYLQNGTGSIGAGGSPDSASKLTVHGSGSTSATNAFAVKNLASNSKFRVDDSIVGTDISIGNLINGYSTLQWDSNTVGIGLITGGGIGVKVTDSFIIDNTNTPISTNSAIAAINSTTRGFLTPRMTTANFAAIASKAQGLEAFSTDDSGKLWYDGTRTVGYRYNGSNFQGYNGSAWANLGALQYFTESYASSTQASSQFLATNSATNINAVLAPKGNGANTAQTPDGTTTGGNSRGFWAVDWQKTRSSADQVASGSQSTIAGGGYNKASGDFSAIPGGYTNEALTNYSLAEGSFAKAYIYGQKSKASGLFPSTSSPGVAQASEVLIRKAATSLNAGDNTELFANGTTEKLIPSGNNRAWNVVVETVAVCTGVGGGSGTVGDTYTSIYNLAFKRVGGTSSIVGTEDLINSNADAGMAGALMVFSAGASQELKIEWQAPTTATGSDFKIVSNVRLTEVAF